MLNALQKKLKAVKAEGFFVQKKQNVRFLSGYTGDDSYLLITPKKQYFLTDPRYTEQAALECPDFEITVWRKAGKTLADCVADLCEKEKLASLGFESDVISHSQWDVLHTRVKAELVPTRDLVEGLRSVKTPEEIDCMRAACEISCRAFERILGDIKVGRTEKELAAKLAAYMVEEGADTQPYGNILITGARTSLLHGIPSSKAVEYGDFVLMDFGCQYKGYLSDMTRTVVVGKASARQREVYEIEKQMVADCEKVMRAGVPLKKVFEASLKAVKGTEYEPYIYTGIGHGIGLFVHEIPFIRPESTEVYEAGVVTTIEPGIYIPGWGGVRIEDQLVITESGCENLVRTTHDLIEL